MWIVNVGYKIQASRLISRHHQITHIAWGLVTLMCVSELGRHWSWPDTNCSSKSYNGSLRQLVPPVTTKLALWQFSVFSVWNNSTKLQERLEYIWFPETETVHNIFIQYHFDGLVQERRNSIANALELRLSYTSPSIYIIIRLILCEKHSIRHLYAHLCTQPYHICAQTARQTAYCKRILHQQWCTKKCHN